MRKVLLVLLPIVFICVGFHQTTKNKVVNAAVDNTVTERLHQQIRDMKLFLVKNKKYNSEIAFFIDMKVPSGKNRFFVYNFPQNKITDQGLVAHGSGSETGAEGQLKFSNVPNSYCTSLGRYRIDQKYNGQFGRSYRLTGLDKTNSNAMARSIVLHYYGDVPYDEQKEPIVNSLGCPMVNKTYFERIEKSIDTSKKKILLQIYY